MLYTCDEFRIKDISEVVPLTESKSFDLKEAGGCYYALGKNCFVYLKYNKETDEVTIRLASPCIKDKKTFGGANEIPFESVDLSSLIESFIVFNHLNPKRMVFENETRVKESHILAKNIANILSGKPVEQPAEKVVDAEVYLQAMDKAKKACKNEQLAVFDSQMPQLY